MGVLATGHRSQSLPIDLAVISVSAPISRMGRCLESEAVVSVDGAGIPTENAAQGLQSFGTIDRREGRDCSGNQTVWSQPMKLADSVMRHREKAPWTIRSEVKADWPVRTSLWERSPDRDLRCSQRSRTVRRPLPPGERSHQETAPAALPTIVESRLKITITD